MIVKSLILRDMAKSKLKKNGMKYVHVMLYVNETKKHLFSTVNKTVHFKVRMSFQSNCSSTSTYKFF
jgi:hypothetical protein